MSEENVKAFERGTVAFNEGDAEALLEVADPAVEFYDVFGRMLGGEERVYRGHQGIRDLIDDLLTFTQPGDDLRVVGIGNAEHDIVRFEVAVRMAHKNDRFFEHA